MLLGSFEFLQLELEVEDSDCPPSQLSATGTTALSIGRHQFNPVATSLVRGLLKLLQPTCSETESRQGPEAVTRRDLIALRWTLSHAPR